jgi:hypothetical protein
MRAWKVLAFVAATAFGACSTILPLGEVQARAGVLREGWSQTVSLSPSALGERLNAFEEGQWTLRRAGAPVCTVDVYHYEYNTKGARGEAVTASGALMVPRGAASACAQPNPILVGLHGTVPDRLYNLADLSGANPASGRALAWAGMYAGQGYIVVAPNYIGLDTSSAIYQSYHNADQQAQDVLDALTAARALLPAVNARASDKVFLAGYSQGGWLAMAVHREMEKRGMPFTASVPMSGAYALSAVVDDVFLGRPVRGSTLYMGLAIRSYQEAYGDLYAEPADLFNSRFSGVATLLPSLTPVPKLIADGQIPAAALFNNMPDLARHDHNDPAQEVLRTHSPAKEPAQFAALYADGFGQDYLINDAYRLRYLRDIQAFPDRGAKGAPLSSGVGLRRAAIRNDMRTWTPKTPMMMCGGPGDGAAPFRFGGEIMMRYWSDPARAPRPGTVSLLDIEAPPGSGGPFGDVRQAFSDDRAGIEAAQTGAPWMDVYHQIVLPRFCYLAARQYFDEMR